MEEQAFMFQQLEEQKYILLIIKEGCNKENQFRELVKHGEENL